MTSPLVQDLLAFLRGSPTPYHAVESATSRLASAGFRALDMRRVKSLLRAPIIVDLRNIYRPEDMARLGFNYSSIGRPGVSH